MCSTVILGAGRHRILAGNYDYSLDHGLIGTNLPGTQSNNDAFPRNPADHPTVKAWRHLFRPHSQSFQFVTNRNRNVREIDLKRIRFDAEAEYLGMDVHAGNEGDITTLLKPYEVEVNRRIVELSDSLFQMPQSDQDELVHLVESIYRTRQMQL